MPTFQKALVYWLKLGCTSFGGPAGQIAMMHRDLVERKKWIGEGHFMHALNFCMFLPGPEAQQLATYLGWRMHGAKGGVAAGALFVLPSMLILYGLSLLYVHGQQWAWLQAAFHGLLPAVIAIIVAAILRIGSRALKTRALLAIAVASFCGIYFWHVSFMVIVFMAGLLGFLGSKFFPRLFPAGAGHGDDGEVKNIIELPPVPEITWQRTMSVVFIFMFLWCTPIAAIYFLLGKNSTAFHESIFFSKAALVTFGGAYAVLPYVAQQAVEKFAWLTQPQMMSGLALAETTPGPLIIVLQFVGFMGGWQNHGSMSPLAAATLCSVVTTWVTFVPSFFFIFLGAPYVEKMHTQRGLQAALTTISAAVVGVMLNLAVSFSQHAVFPSGMKSIDFFVLITAVLAFVGIKKYRVGTLTVIAACAALGLGMYFFR